VRVPVVDHQRLAGPLGDLDVLAEPPALHVGGGVVAVVVQAGLADGDDPRQRGEGLDVSERLGRGRLGLVGMDGHGGMEPLVLARPPRRPARGFQVGADRDDADNARGPGRRHHFRYRQVDHVQVSVAVERGPGQRRRRARGGHHGPFG